MRAGQQTKEERRNNSDAICVKLLRALLDSPALPDKRTCTESCLPKASVFQLKREVVGLTRIYSRGET